MKRIPPVNNEMANLIRMRRGQITSQHVTQEEEKPKKNRTYGNYKKKTEFEIFQKKYDNLDKYIDSFRPKDLVYYFKTIAEESGYRYFPSLGKDCHIFKVLLEDFSAKEICGMIEFLYTSEQDYLNKDRLSPNVLASRWINTVYADFKLWLEDEYVPKSKKVHQQREWTSPVDTNSTKIGEW